MSLNVGYYTQTERLSSIKKLELKVHKFQILYLVHILKAAKFLIFKSEIFKLSHSMDIYIISCEACTT